MVMNMYTLMFFLGALSASRFPSQIGLPGQRPVIATGIRALIHLSAVKGGKTGPAMNPMIATAWVRGEGEEQQ